MTREVELCTTDPNRFNSVLLGAEQPFWWRQREVCRSVVQYRETNVKSGNGVGKTHLLARLAVWAFSCHPDCKVILSAPTLGQLEGAVWGEIETAYRSAQNNGLPLGGKLRRLVLEEDASWRLECFGSGSVESKSGRHSRHLFVLIDEASGTPRQVDEAIASLNASKIVRMGNPLRPEGMFYEACELSSSNPYVNVIKIPSTDSPHVHLERSPYGMADRTFIETSRHQYGEDSIWWLSHVLAEFPGEIHQALLPIAWLARAGEAAHERGGEIWLGVDLGEGKGGDPTELVARDDNGIVDWASSNRWDFEQSANQVREMAITHGIEPGRIVFDANGIGADFDNRLRAVGLMGCKGFRGSSADLSGKCANLRTAVAWAFRRRLDPNWSLQVRHPSGRLMLPTAQKPFAIPQHLLTRYRVELQGLKYELGNKGEIALQNREDFIKAIKKSPNFLDALFMTYAYPYA